MTKKEVFEKISAKVSDKDIANLATKLVVAGEENLDVAVKRATEELQESVSRKGPAKEDIDKNKGRRKVVVQYLSGSKVAGWKTEYWEDIAQMLEARGEVKIIASSK